MQTPRGRCAECAPERRIRSGLSIKTLHSESLSEPEPPPPSRSRAPCLGQGGPKAENPTRTTAKRHDRRTRISQGRNTFVRRCGGREGSQRGQGSCRGAGWCGRHRGTQCVVASAIKQDNSPQSASGTLCSRLELSAVAPLDECRTLLNCNSCILLAEMWVTHQAAFALQAD